MQEIDLYLYINEIIGYEEKSHVTSWINPT